jgi:hypothetical protein
MILIIRINPFICSTNVESFFNFVSSADMRERARRAVRRAMRPCVKWSGDGLALSTISKFTFTVVKNLEGLITITDPSDLRSGRCSVLDGAKSVVECEQMEQCMITWKNCSHQCKVFSTKCLYSCVHFARSQETLTPPSNTAAVTSRGPL